MAVSTQPVGTHILSELHRCSRSCLRDLGGAALYERVSELVRRERLMEVGACCREFDEGGTTCLIALAESHIAIHTWPELGYVTLEVYVCNYSRNNSSAAERVHRVLVDLFAPAQVHTRTIQR